MIPLIHRDKGGKSIFKNNFFPENAQSSFGCGEKEFSTSRSIEIAQVLFIFSLNVTPD